MTLRFKTWNAVFIWGPNPDSLKFTSSFSHKNFSCSLRIEVTKSIEAESMPLAQRYYGKADYVQFTVSDTGDNQFLKAMIDRREYNRIDELLQSTANRCIRSIRNRGNAPHFHELPRNDAQDAEKRLFQLRVEVADDGDGWKPLIPSPKDGGLLFFALMESQPDTTTNLNVSEWPDIDEAIQDNLPPAPEDEFKVNAIEHLRLKNLRLALLESVIGLEIVLTRFVKEYLRVRRNTPKARINKFLAPQVGLTARLAGVLDLTLPDDALKSVDLDKVMKAVEWRNSITHKTGHLPSGLPETTVQEGIVEVIDLTGLLALRANQLIASPDAQEISNYLYDKHGIASPSVWFLPSHRIAAEFTIFPSPFDKFPDDSKLNAVVSDFIAKRKEQDGRFEAAEHLFISFFEFPRVLRARWRKGNLEMVESKRQPQ